MFGTDVPPNEQPQSLTRNGLVNLLKDLCEIANDKGHHAEKLTSHDLRAIFTDSLFEGRDGVLYGKKIGLKFHPKQKYKRYYSTEPPIVIATYSWEGLCFLRDLPRFLNEIDIILESSDPKRTYWFDIFQNDQSNKIRTAQDLQISSALYKTVRYHVVLMCKGTLSRGWCNYEVSTRIFRIMEHEGIVQEDIPGRILHGDDRLPIAVIVPGLTGLRSDVYTGSRNPFDSMKTYYEEDKVEIQNSIIKSFGTKEAFNYLMILYRNAVLAKHALRHPVRWRESLLRGI